MNEQFDRRSDGSPYDEELASRAAANGIGSPSGEQPPAKDNPYNTEDGSDLMLVASPEANLNDVRLQDIEAEIFMLKQQGELTKEEADDYALLEAEKIVRLEQRRLDEITEQYSFHADALKAWMLSEIAIRQENGEQINDEMHTEAEILDALLEEIKEDGEDDHFTEVAMAMQSTLVAQHKQTLVQSQLSLAS